MSNEYLAVVRVTAASTSQKCRYIADNVKHSIDKLCAISGVKSTMDLFEFEIMEVLNGGTAYRPVSSKSGPKARTSMIQVGDKMPPRVEPKQEAMDKVDNGTSAVLANVSNIVPKRDETSYTPYKVKVDV